MRGQGLEEDAEERKPEEHQGGVEGDVEDEDHQPRARGPAEDGALLRVVEEELDVLPAFSVPTGGLQSSSSHDVFSLLLHPEQEGNIEEVPI